MEHVLNTVYVGAPITINFNIWYLLPSLYYLRTQNSNCINWAIPAATRYNPGLLLERKILTVKAEKGYHIINYFSAILLYFFLPIYNNCYKLTNSKRNKNIIISWYVYVNSSKYNRGLFCIKIWCTHCLLQRQ